LDFTREEIEDYCEDDCIALSRVAGEIASLMAIATAGLRMPLVVNNPAVALHR